MAKVKICLDSACVKYILVEGDRLIHQKKAKCDLNWKPSKDFDEKYNAMTKVAKETMYASPDMFKDIEEGKDLTFGDTDTTSHKTKEEEVAELEKRLKELKA